MRFCAPTRFPVNFSQMSSHTPCFKKLAISICIASVALAAGGAYAGTSINRLKVNVQGLRITPQPAQVTPPASEPQPSPGTELKAVGVSSTVLAFEPTRPGDVLSKSVSVVNTGTAPVSIAALSSSSPLFLVQSNCVGALPPAGHCPVTVSFAPSQAGSAQGELRIDTDAPGSPLTVALSGNTPVYAGALSSITAEQFGPAQPGAAVSRQYAFDNTGNVSLTSISASLAGDPSFAITGNTCPVAGLPAGQRCLISVTWFASQSAGTTLRVSAAELGSSQSLELTSQVIPDWSTVSLMLPFNGAPNSTTFTDATGKHTITGYGQAKISDAVAYSNSTSLLLNGTSGTRLHLPAIAGPSGTIDFTVEAWVYLHTAPPAGSHGAPIVSQYSWYGNTNSSFMFKIEPSRVVSFAVTNNSSSNAYLPTYQVGTNHPTIIPLKQWTHVALARKGGYFTLFVNGQPSSRVSHAEGAAYKVNPSTRPIAVGYHPDVAGGSPSYLNANLDDIRIVKGAAMYDGPFIPPGPMPLN